MSKLLATIKKNFTVLLRDRVAAFTVLIAPLLIVFLVGFAYSSGGTTTLLVGATDTNTSAVERIQASSTFQVVEAATLPACRDRVERGIFDACVDVSKGDTTGVDIIVDESRQDIARSVESTMRKELAAASQAQRREIVERRFQNISDAIRVVDEQLAQLSKLNKSLQDTKGHAETITDTNTVSTVQSNEVDGLRDATEDLRDTAETFESELSALQSDADAFLGVDVNSSTESLSEYQRLENQTNASESVLLDSSVEDVSETINDAVDNAESALQERGDAVDQANNRLSDAQSSANSILNTIDETTSEISSLRKGLLSIRSGLESLASDDVSRVTNPLRTEVSRIGQTTFSFGKATPYLVGLETFLFALLLGGAIAFNQNMGGAANRELIAPVGSGTRVIAAVLTGLSVSAVQTLITAGAAIGHLGIWTVNLPTVLFFCFVASVMSLLIGVILGQLFETMQGLLLGALATGTVFISLSDFVAPLEQFHPVAESIGNYNPYTLAVDGLRQSMFFDVALPRLAKEAVILGGVVVFLAVLATYLQYLWKKDTSSQQAPRLVKARMELDQVRSAKDLTSWLDGVSYRTYRDLRGRVSGVLDGLGIDVQVPWIRKGRLSEAVQSSSSMSSMSSSESRSSSSSSTDTSSSASDSSDEDVSDDSGDASSDSSSSSSDSASGS